MPPLPMSDPQYVNVGEVEDLASRLMDAISLSQSKLQDWVDAEKEKADKEAETYQDLFLGEQAKIDSQVSELMTLQAARGLEVGNNSSNITDDEQNDAENMATKKLVAEDSKISLQFEIVKLESELKSRETRLYDISVEESKQRKRAEEVRVLKQRIEEAKQTTVDDLTKGIVNYKYLGLDFEKTGVDNALRFSFSRLDPLDPTRLFTFILQVNGDDKYEIVECEPPINVLTLMGVSSTLNETDDMSYLVRKLRREFINTLDE